MLRNKAFNKKTNKGKVVRVVTEHYLRDDIPCRISECTVCPKSIASTNQPLPTTNTTSTSFISLPHYLIPDTNIVVDQLDVLDKLDNVVVLATVVDEAKNLSLKVYNRLKPWISDESRRIQLFSNEHHKETFVERLPNETPNDRNDRAIRIATKWYVDHLNEQFPGKVTAVLLTDDRDNRAKAKQMGLQAFSISEYIGNVTDNDQLVDLLAVRTDHKLAKLSLDHYDYPEYISNLAMTTGLGNNRYLKGILNVSDHNYLESSIYTNFEGKPTRISILGRKSMNRAVHGDQVCVELLPKSEWRAPSAIVVESEADELKLDQETPITAATHPDEIILPCGKVVAVVKRNWRPYCGYLYAGTQLDKEVSNDTTVNAYFQPLDSRVPRIKLQTRQFQQLSKSRVVVSIDGWSANAKFPSGHLVKTLGTVGDRDVETEVLLLEHDVPYHEFSKHILAELPSEGESWVVQESDFSKRIDFRDLDICSIDPPGCTDIDDALHASKLPNGNYQVGVHIADVTHFVKPGTQMDQEAANRCTSVYLVNKRIDMLPGLLGTNLCSLRSDVERLAFSCLWEITEDGTIVDTQFCKSVIKSKHSFTYQAAQERIDDANLKDSLTEGLRALNRFAQLFKAKRMEAGALTLSSPEVRFKMENDSQDPVDVEMKALHSTNALVEEFMLLANVAVATRIYKAFPASALLRSHMAPPATNFEVLNKALLLLGDSVQLQYGSSKQLADSLDRIDIPSDPYLNQLVRILTTRCMTQARYIPSGAVSEPEFWHYGLACPIYTHFTSPIHVLVHRLLYAAIDNEQILDPRLLNQRGMKHQCDVLNKRHHMAQLAARASIELYTHLYFQDTTVVEEAYVIKVLRNGFVVLIPKFGLESIVHLEASYLTAPILFNFDATSNSLNFINRTTSSSSTSKGEEAKIQLFMKVKVQLQILEKDMESGLGRKQLVTRLVKPFINNLSVTESTENEEKMSPNKVPRLE